MNSSLARIALSVSLGLNVVLFIILVVLEARVSKLESKHYDSNPLVIEFGLGEK
tara:strand:- start:3151 stop:3312 length:162 start_codon:yes stop_codon:yes gene_type:complete